MAVVARDLDTWPGARESVHSRMRRGAGDHARKLFSLAVLADEDECDREILREWSVQPQGTVFIGRRTMILTDPATSALASGGRRRYAMSGAPALVGGVYALFEAAWEAAADLATFLGSDRPPLKWDRGSRSAYGRASCD